MNEINLRTEIETAVKSFMKLGFLKYESEVLAILTAIGTATAKEIHRHTTVPLPKVYQTLDSLSEEKMIKKHTQTRPAEFTAYSPKIIIKKIQAKNRELERKLRHNLDQLAELTAPTFSGDVFPFSGAEALKRIGRSVIEGAKKELLVAMSPDVLVQFDKVFAIAKEKGVVVKSLMISQLTRLTKKVATKKYLELQLEHFEVELPIKVKPAIDFLQVVKLTSPIIDYLGILLSDTGESMILLPLFPEENFFGIWICSKEIVSRQAEIFKAILKIAKKV